MWMILKLFLYIYIVVSGGIHFAWLLLLKEKRMIGRLYNESLSTMLYLMKQSTLQNYWNQTLSHVGTWTASMSMYKMLSNTHKQCVHIFLKLLIRWLGTQLPTTPPGFETGITSKHQGSLNQMSYYTGSICTYLVTCSTSPKPK